MARTRQTWRVLLGWAVACIVLAWMLAGCGGGDAPPSSYSAVIGPAGGTLTGPNGVQVVVPAGALAQATTLSVARSATGAPTLIDSAKPAGSVYEFTPHDIVFARPVLIRLPVPAGATGTDVLMSSPTMDWSLNDAVVSNGMAEFQRNSFSWGYVALGCSYNPNDPNLYPSACVWPKGGAGATANPSTAMTRRTQPLPYSNTAGSFFIDQATTVTLSIGYRTYYDCQNTRVIIKRKRVDLPGTSSYTTVFDQPVTLADNQATPPSRALTGNTTLDVPFTNADNGTHSFWLAFSCNRPGQAATFHGDFLVIESAIAAAASSYAIGGTVSGLTGTGLVLQNNGGDNLTVAADGTFNFSTALASGATYAVTVQAQPSGQTCSVQNASGTATAAVSNVVVSCSATVVPPVVTPAANCTGPSNTGWCRTSSSASALTGVSFGSSQVGLANQMYASGSTFRTTDGGITWTTGPYFLQAYRAYNYGMAFADANTVIAVGSNADNDDAVLYRSTDAGQTWSLVYSAPYATLGVWLQSPVFLDANVGLVAAGQYVLRTTDGGLTWTRIAHGQAETITNFVSLGGGTVIGSGYLFGGNTGRMLRSVDGGQTWSAGALLTGWFQYIRQMSFMNANTGIAKLGASSGQTNLARTTDGGVTWTLQTLSTTAGSYLDAVVLSSDGTGVVTTGNGEMLRTADGGATWQAVNSGTTQPLKAGASPAAGVFVLVGDGGVVRNAEGGNGP